MHAVTQLQQHRLMESHGISIDSWRYKSNVVNIHMKHQNGEFIKFVEFPYNAVKKCSSGQRRMVRLVESDRKTMVTQITDI